jgi:hypothetical protein
MKKPCFPERIRTHGGWGEAPTTMCAVLFSGQGGFPSPCWCGVSKVRRLIPSGELSTCTFMAAPPGA